MSFGKTAVYAALVAGALGCGQGLFAEDSSGYVNVQDFIAKSTNKADHTEAIRAAFAEAVKTRVYKVLFPAGNYTISDTIDISGGNVTTPGATITQTNPEKDIFYTEDAWRRTIRNFTFRDGRDQIAWGNRNTDQGFLVVSECHFYGANGVAIRFLGGPGYPRLTTQSTFCLVEKCAFTDCAQTLVAVSDQSHLRDCWISTKHKKDNKAVIENYGCLTCLNILGVPRPSHTDQRWIDNYGGLSCTTFRFGGEGAGFTPVVNYSKYSPDGAGGGITLDSCYVGAVGNNKRPCAIYLEEIPNAIVIRNCSLDGVPALKVNPKLDLKTYFNAAKPGMLLFDVANNVGEFAGALPQEMIAAAAKRQVGALAYGDEQFTPAETEKALAAAVAAAKSFSSAKEPGVMTYGLPKGQEGHRQVMDPAKYVDINPKTHAWDLSDHLDARSELNSACLALAPAGDDIVLMCRKEKMTFPHVRIRNIAVDLDKTPFLTWRLKDNGVKGGHMAIKVINRETEGMTLVVEDRDSDQLWYYAYDLRKALDIPHGKVNIDIKFYLCGGRTDLNIKKGEYFLIDFIRLEAQ